MSSNFGIHFELRAEDRASEALKSVIEVLRQGTAASQDAKTKFSELSANVNLQSRAIREMRSEWRVAHIEMFEATRVMSAIGSIGHSLLGIVTALSVAGSRTALANRELQKAIEDVQDAYMLWQKSIADKKPLEEQLKLHGEYVKAQNELKRAQEEVTKASQGETIAIAGIGLSMIGVGSAIVQTVSHLSLLAHNVGMTTSAFLAAQASVAVVSAAIVAVAGAISFATVGAAKLRIETGQWITSWDQAMDSMRLFPPIVREAGAALLVFAGLVGKDAEATVASIAKLPEQISGIIGNVKIRINLGLQVAGSYFEEFATNTWNTVREWGVGVLDWFAKLPDRIGTAIVRLPAIIGNAVKGALNVAVDLINGFINFVNSIINQINSISGMVGLPAIGNIPNIPRLERGGIVMKPTLVLAGESGPEAIVPLGSRAGISSTINVYVQGSVVTEDELAKSISRKIFLEYTRLAR